MRLLLLVLVMAGSLAASEPAHADPLLDGMESVGDYAFTTIIVPTTRRRESTSPPPLRAVQWVR